MESILPWVISCVTIFFLYRAGDGKRDAWEIALFGNLLWLMFIMMSHTWGLLPMNIVLWYMYVRNYRKWA